MNMMLQLSFFEINNQRMKGLHLRDQNSSIRVQRTKDLSFQDGSDLNLQKKKVDSRTKVNVSIQQLIQEQQKKTSQKQSVKRSAKNITDNRKRQSVEPRQRMNSLLQKRNPHQESFIHRKTNNNVSFNQSYHHPHDVSEDFHLKNYIDIQEDFSREDQNWASKPSLAERHNEYLTIQKSDKHFDRGHGGDSEVQIGKKLFSEGKTEEARRKFEQALETNANHPEARYLIGVCHLSAADFVNAIKQLTLLIESKPLFKKNVYILCAIAMKKENDLQGALKIVNHNLIIKLTKAISQFPKYYDALIYRGKLLLRMKAWDRALLDFEAAVKLQEKKSIGFIGSAEALRFLGKEEDAIYCYTQAIKCNDAMKRAAIMKRAVLFIETQKYQEAKNDIAMMLNEDPGNSEALYFKGFIQSKQGLLQEALLSFEQAIKHNNSKKAVTKALYEIAKIKIEQRDYYAAFHQLCRADYLDVDHKALERFRIFTDGVTFLMKRKYKEGVDHLTNLINNYPPTNFLRPLLFQYRAYGYICIGKHQKALNDLQTVEKQNPLDKASAYNKFICEGIQGASQDQFEQALGFFLKAQKLLPNKMEPYFYRATTLIRFCNKLIQQDQEKRDQYLNDALKYFIKATEINDSSSNLLYYKGILLFCLGRLDLAYADLEKAIDKSEDNVANHFFVRGLLQGCQKNYKPALNDFSIAINLDDKLYDAYLNRAKAFQVLGDRNSAYYDVQKFLQSKTLDQKANYQAAVLLFHIGAYDDAVKAFTSIPISSRNCKEILYLRAKCYIILKELNNALQDLERIFELTQDPKAEADYQVLSTLKTTSTNQTLEGYADGIGIINQVLKRDIEGEVFKRSDMIFYKSVYLSYIGDYRKAKLLLKESYELKEKCQTMNQSKKLPNDDDLSQLLDNSFAETEGRLECKQHQLEDFEFFDRTYNVFEYLYNSAVIELMLGQKQNAQDLIQTMIESVPDEQRDLFNELISFIQGETIDKEEFLPFPSHNRLCSIFGGLKIKYATTVELKLSFCLPTVEMPSMAFCFDQKLLDISPTVVENRPEAPWIKRGAEGVIFTDNIQQIDDLDLMSEKRETTNKNEEQDELNLEGEMFAEYAQSDSQQKFDHHIEQALKQEQPKNSRHKHYDYSILDQSQLQIDNSKDEEMEYDPQALKQQLMLDSNIAKKLDQLLKKKNQ